MNARRDHESREPVSGEDLYARLTVGYVCSIAHAASLLGLTVQRVNQLAAEGVVVKLGRGVCNFTESLHRYTAFSSKRISTPSRAGVR